jgi:hypothetical protein
MVPGATLGVVEEEEAQVLMSDGQAERGVARRETLQLLSRPILNLIWGSDAVLASHMSQLVTVSLNRTRLRLRNELDRALGPTTGFVPVRRRLLG